MTDTDHESLIQRIIPNRPAGNAHTIRAGANAWRTVAQTLDDETGALDRITTGASGFWQGSGYDAFKSEWLTLSREVYRGTGQIRQFASQLEELAGKIEDAQRAYDAALIAAGITITVGIAATFITFGASDAIAGGAVAAEVGGAVAVAEAAAASAAISLAGIAEVVAHLSTLFLIGFGTSLGAQGLASAVVYPDHHPFHNLNFQQMVISGAGFAVLGGVSSGLGFVETGSTALNATIRLGGFGLGASGFDAAMQKLTTGGIDPVQVLFAGGSATALAAAGLGIGTMRQRVLIAELQESGVKVDPERVIGIGRERTSEGGYTGRIVFLEGGAVDASAQGVGALKILEPGRAAQFAAQGVPPAELPKLVLDTAAGGRQVGWQGQDTPIRPARAVYAYEYKGSIRYMAIQVGENGFIVGANPRSDPGRPVR